ncbi:hypothetical protein L0F51_03900 [Afifella sp. H1R]|uniref:hypothetical protein n=1 Tax=Afifella sp. H1R TaxID=2908841 RepID=UPI001F25D97B|nr:hypothetical protein [Afifella sp. H1R]MCF1502909.1 hypothetical protein [Afifella sp. H1R]
MVKTEYIVADGVEWVNGARVPATRRVRLTEAEALYDRALGRIAAVPDLEALEAMTKDELKAEAKRRGIDLDHDALKADILAALKAAV